MGIYKIKKYVFYSKTLETNYKIIIFKIKFKYKTFYTCYTLFVKVSYFLVQNSFYLQEF